MSRSSGRRRIDCWRFVVSRGTSDRAWEALRGSQRLSVTLVIRSPTPGTPRLSPRLSVALTSVDVSQGPRRPSPMGRTPVRANTCSGPHPNTCSVPPRAPMKPEFPNASPTYGQATNEHISFVLIADLLNNDWLGVDTLTDTGDVAVRSFSSI